MATTQAATTVTDRRTDRLYTYPTPDLRQLRESLDGLIKHLEDRGDVKAAENATVVLGDVDREIARRQGESRAIVGAGV